ncbi:glycoside hydrolase family 28 protein [Novosphingobium soli]|uniref:Glycoside hydrolase family 28 protein n=1 Tax=Novosphingobium soli TaxID=574956 RepID=A0ABV6CZK4_9SPHN
MRVDRRGFVAAAGIAGGLALAIPREASARGKPAPRVAPPTAPRLPGSGLRIDPREFGARADGRTKDTAAIQQALDRCAVLGGGEVVLSGGTFLTGAIRIGSSTTLSLAQDALLRGSDDLADYPVTQVRWEGRWIPGYIGLVSAQGARDVRLVGKGRIVASRAIRGRVAASGLRHPALLEFVDVQRLAVAGLTTEQNDMWSIHPVYCEDVLFEGLVVHGGADGIDVDSCRRVAIARCTFDTADDCISLKSGRGLEGHALARPTEDVAIADCTFTDRRWACIGIGSETSGGIRRVSVDRCRFLSAYTFSIYIKSRPGRGAFIEDIAMRDLEVGSAGDGFLRLNFLDSGKQDPFPVPGDEGIPQVRRLSFERVRVADVPTLVQATSIHPAKPVEGFVLRAITGAAERGIFLANMRDVVLESVAVTVRSGAALSTANVTGRGLAGAAALEPTPAPPPVAPDPVPYRLGMTGTPN